MEERKKIKVSLNKATLLSIIFLTLLIAVIIIIINYNRPNIRSNSNSYVHRFINGKTYYERLNESKWKGHYYQKEFYTANKVKITEVVSYERYLEIIKEMNSLVKYNGKIITHYLNKNCNYVILAYASGYSFCTMDLIDYVEENDKIIIYGYEESNGVMGDGSGYFIAIPTNMPIGTEIEYRQCYTSYQINDLKKYDNPYDPTEMSSDKPIIYLYPTKDEEISVSLLKDEKITCSYPKYKDEWKVLAKPNGDLKDLDTNRKLYSLYYESKNIVQFQIEDEGFVIKGEDTIAFLEEKLSILGLTEREAEEFIIYWLPKLESNKYNYIRFATMDEINENMPLEINPNPDTIIRVLMIFKGLDEPINVQEQQLYTPLRKGFVAVEWGGTEIN